MQKSMMQAMREGISRVSGKVADMPVQEVILARMLMTGGDLVMTRLTELLRPHGLSESDFRTLVVLFSSNEGGVHPSELCHFATQKPTNMTRIADGLVARGMATRRHSEADRRRILIQISPSGRRLVKSVLPLLFPRVRSLFSVLNKQEKSQLDRILGKLTNHLAEQALTEKDAP